MREHGWTATSWSCRSAARSAAFREPRSRLQGQANAENALAAWLAARAVGVDDMDVQIAFGTFAGLPHRMVLVRELDGVTWINDSKGTNVDATLKSLEGFDGSSVILILGGKDKAGEFERMRDLVKSKARTVLTIGKAADRIAEALARRERNRPRRRHAQRRRSGRARTHNPATPSSSRRRARASISTATSSIAASTSRSW